MNTHFSPMKGSVPWKVIEFLTTNSSETLTVDDISVKFEVPVRGLPAILTPAVDSGALLRTEDPDEDEMVYRLGKGHPQIKPRPSLHPSLGHAMGEVKKTRKRLVIDASKIPIATGIPIPEHAGNGRTNWNALFDRMALNQSADLPLSTRGTIQKCVNAYAKSTGKTFTIRRHDDETLRLWRTK